MKCRRLTTKSHKEHTWNDVHSIFSLLDKIYLDHVTSKTSKTKMHLTSQFSYIVNSSTKHILAGLNFILNQIYRQHICEKIQQILQICGMYDDKGQENMLFINVPCKTGKFWHHEIIKNSYTENSESYSTLFYLLLN